jgi:N-acetylglucosamine repressor
MMPQPSTDFKATHQHTKVHNDRLVLSTIYGTDKISRAAVARRTGLSRTSVGEAVSELLERDLVEEVGRGRPNGGKPPILLRVKTDARHLVGVDLSGEAFRGAVYNLRGEVRHSLSVPREGRSGAAALELAYVLLDRLVEAAEAPVLGLGIGTPGLIDFQRGSHVHWAVNLDWLEIPLRELLQVRYGLPVHVLNDSQAAAMGEYYFGADHPSTNLVVIKCEEGLGAGIVLNGQLLHGDHFGAGEIGHVVFSDDGRQCRCGNTGCLETVASGSAIVRAARTAALANPASPLRPAALREFILDMPSIHDAYLAGDPDVRGVVHAAARGIGLAIATLVGTLNARDIVIAGSVTQLGEPFLEAVRGEVMARCLAALARDTQIEFSTIASDITSLGAAAVLLHQELGIWPLVRPLAAAAENRATSDRSARIRDWSHPRSLSPART